uniref:Uncharacterized protein n=1 Tax=Roseihalotalea indica TaxID=2867963 RepID=A0AA49GKL7_9BACT|nr:hypothetical protein K4G66_24270 [Tunicatimonas sp. TK19036]
MNVSQLGVHSNLSAYLQRKTRLNNQVAVMCFWIGFIYVFFVYAHYPELAIYPALLFVISALVLALNFVGYLQLARFINSFQMITLATLFHASILQQSEPLLVPFFCTQLAMTMIPWVLYDWREKSTMIISLVICYGLVASQQLLNKAIEVPVDVTFFRESYLTPMTYFCAAFIQVACILWIKAERPQKEEASDDKVLESSQEKVLS